MSDLGFGLQPQIEYITSIEAPKKIAWSMGNKPGDLIHASDLKDYAEKRH